MRSRIGYAGILAAVITLTWPVTVGAAPAPSSIRDEVVRTQDPAERPGEGDPVVSRGRMLVRFQPGIPAEAKRAARSSVGGTPLRTYHLVPGLELLGVSDAVSASARLSRNPNVSYATPDIGMRLQAIPNDPLFPQQWSLSSIGAPAAWGRVTGSSSVTVATLDTGIALDHPDLAANLWTNPDETPGNGVDDDANGYVDDVHGWDFTTETNDPSDTVGHGTHVAGTIGAVANDGVGVAGVNWTVGLMPLKVCTSVCYQSDEIAALQYAVDEGARIANSSFGGQSAGYLPERDAIAAAGEAGLLDVAAAGNAWTDNDLFPFYPASYPLGNIVSVAATQDVSGALAAYSNYGSTSVDLAAPGSDILSTLPEGAYGTSGGYGRLSGTSMAAPHVAGAAALLWAQHPAWTMSQVRNRLLTTARSRPSLAGMVLSCGELDLAAATDPAVPSRARLCARRTGTGSGTVTSSPAGVSCGPTCAATFTPGSTVTLTASAGAGSTFAGWSPPCSGTGACVVTAQGAKIISARFRASPPPGWTQAMIRAPTGVDVLPAGSDVFSSFANVSQSADGTVRAKTVYHVGGGWSDTGGIYLERLAGGTFTPDGTIAAPSLGIDQYADWPKRSGWGTVTRISGDGEWLLASPEPAYARTAEGLRDRCAAFVYRRDPSGWVLDASLVPPNADPASGIADAAGCFGWGYEGGISDAGDRVAMWGAGRVDVYRRDASGWALEQEIALPVGDGCGATAAPRRLGFSGDGGSLIASDPDCRAGRRAYVYERLGPAWVQTATLTDVAAEDVSISDGGILVTINTAVYAKDATGWHRRTTLSVPGSLHLGCPAIVRNGTRIVCGSIEDVGYNRSQGVVYVFDAAEGGWGNGAIMTARLFAPDGFAADGLTMSGMLRWSMAAVTDDGTSILAPMMPDNVAAGLNPHDLMGYGFTSATPAVAVSIADTGFVPASVTVAQGTTITWTNRGTRSHTATDSTGMRLFASGTLAVGASYSFTFAAAGVYPYRSAVPEPSPLTGRVKVPLRVSPSTGGTTTSFAVTWASGVPPSGYVEDVQERFKACASCAWGAWTSWKSGQTAVSASFVPSHGKGTYAFRARIRKLSNGTASNWSPVTSITVT